MRRNILYLLSIGICLFTCVGSHAAAPETRAHLERGRSLFDHGRWTDARYELLKAREGADRDDRLTLQQIDYQLAVCALKLGSRDAEAMLADFSMTSRYRSVEFFLIVTNLCKRPKRVNNARPYHNLCVFSKFV